MKTVNDLLNHADPLRDESPRSSAEHDRLRQKLATAAAVDRSPVSSVWFRRPVAVLAMVAVIAIGVAVVGARVWSGGSAVVEAAAVRFEVRLAETQPAADLRVAHVAGSDRVIYLHQEVIVSNGDIESSRVIEGDDPSHFSVSVEFTSAGAEKIRDATANHLGEQAAILIDGEVVMAPTIRAAIGSSAVITGSFTKVEADRIANGLGVR